MTIFKMSLEQCNIFQITADASVGGGLSPRAVPYIFRKLFSRATFATEIVCLYLVPFRSYLASKLTVLENSTYLARGSYMGAIPTNYTFLDSSFHEQHLPRG